MAVQAKLGAAAPDFTMPTDGGGTVALGALRGKTIVPRAEWCKVKVPGHFDEVLKVAREL